MEKRTVTGATGVEEVGKGTQDELLPQDGKVDLHRQAGLI